MVVGDFTENLDVVVIGSGPGGYVAAIRAAQLGKKVTIIEKNDIGGTCLNVGCIPSKALIQASKTYKNVKNSSFYNVQENEDFSLDFNEVQKWKDQQVVNQLSQGVESLLKKNKVEILTGEAFFVDSSTIRVIFDEEKGEVQSYTFNQAIIATGSRPIELKNLRFGDRIIDSTGALNLKEIPTSLSVVGGGYIGIEIATIYANLGVDVTIFEAMPEILNGFDQSMVTVVKNRLKEKDVKVLTDTIVKDTTKGDDKVTIHYEVDGKEETLESEYLLVSVGRKPNTDDIGLHLAHIECDKQGLIKVDNQGRTNRNNIFAIGDIVAGPALAHKASYEAKIVAEVINGDDSAAVDYLALPAVCFSDPELAMVGYTKEEATDMGYSVKTAKFPMAANSRALTLQETEGYVELIVNKEDMTLLGGQIVGPNASELIAEITLAIEQGLSIEDITLTIHSHPSLSEIIMDTAELASGFPIHI